MSPALLSRNGSAPKRQEYLQQSVQDFFGGLSWEGAAPQRRSPQLDQLDQLAAPTPGLETVSQFFERFAWDGEPIIGAPVDPNEIFSPAAAQEDGSDLDGLTLDAFSDLF